MSFLISCIFIYPDTPLWIADDVTSPGLMFLVYTHSTLLFEAPTNTHKPLLFFPDCIQLIFQCNRLNYYTDFKDPGRHQHRGVVSRHGVTLLAALAWWMAEISPALWLQEELTQGIVYLSETCREELKLELSSLCRCVFQQPHHYSAHYVNMIEIAYYVNYIIHAGL